MSVLFPLIGFSRRLIDHCDLRFTVKTVSATSRGSSGGGMAGSVDFGGSGRGITTEKNSAPVAPLATGPLDDRERIITGTSDFDTTSFRYLMLHSQYGAFRFLTFRYKDTASLPQDRRR